MCSRRGESCRSCRDQLGPVSGSHSQTLRHRAFGILIGALDAVADFDERTEAVGSPHPLDEIVPGLLARKPVKCRNRPWVERVVTRGRSRSLYLEQAGRTYLCTAPVRPVSMILRNDIQAFVSTAPFTEPVFFSGISPSTSSGAASLHYARPLSGGSVL